MKKRVIPTINVSLKPSNIILGCYIAISMLSIFALMLAQLPLMLQIFLILTVIIATMYILLQAVWLLLPWSWVKVEVNHEGKFRVTNKRRQTFDVQLLGTSLNHRWLTVLHFNLGSNLLDLNNTLVFTPWQVVDVDQYRKLRVWLKWGTPLSAQQAEFVKR